MARWVKGIPKNIPTTPTNIRKYEGYRLHMRNQRVRLGLTQAYVAKKLHVVREAVTQWENGTREPDFITAKKLQVLLKANTVEDILERYYYGNDGVFVGEFGGHEIWVQ